jgi:hypothetical protein
MVKPSNFTSQIKIARTIVARRIYQGSTLIDSLSKDNAPDDSDPAGRDDDPQPNGFVYDGDGPSIGQTPAPPDGTILRRRTNFFQFAFIANGLTARLSANLNWYNRISIIFTGGAAQLSNTITGDNVSGTGTTNLSWNLQ